MSVLGKTESLGDLSVSQKEKAVRDMCYLWIRVSGRMHMSAGDYRFGGGGT